MLRASGPAGTLRVGYQVAAELGAWDMELAAQRLPPTFIFHAAVRREHAYWITQEPLDLVLSLGSAEWLWRGVVVGRAPGGRIRIELTERPIVSERAPQGAAAEPASQQQQKTRNA